MWVVYLNEIPKENSAEVGACVSEDCGGKKEQDEVMGVVVANTSIDENAVVVKFGNTATADATVFGARGLHLIAGTAHATGDVEGVIVGIEGSMKVEGLKGDVSGINVGG